jgi:anti-sigma28 factor (negative regulator of flagellin synthesis)
MSRITFRTILLVSSLVTLVLSFNLLVGAQDQPPNKQTDKTSQTAKEKSSASDANKTQDADKTQDANKAMQAGATATGMLSSDDKKFIKEAAHGGMMEVDLGKLAAQKAMSDEVKQFGQRMADDHSKANDELMLDGLDRNFGDRNCGRHGFARDRFADEHYTNEHYANEHSTNKHFADGHHVRPWPERFKRRG